MTASDIGGAKRLRRERWRPCHAVLGTVLAGCLTAAGSMGLAAADEPLQLLPPHMRPQPGAPSSPTPPSTPTLAPAPADPAPVAAPVSSPSPAPSQPTVERQPLAQVPAVFGLFGPAAGGLPPDLWQGTAAKDVRALLARLPIATESLLLSDLRRRLLLSQQRPPTGLSPAALLSARLELLDRQGAPTETLERLAAPLVGTDLADLADRVRLRARLIDGLDEAACALARAEAARRRDMLWQKALVYCDVRAGRAGRAQMGLSMLREMRPGGAANEGEGEDEGFFRLAERQAGIGAPSVDSLAGASVVAYALLRRYPDMDAPADSQRPGAPWTARAVALGPNGPPALRARAAEQAAAAGALNLNSLAMAWRRAVADPRDLATPVSQVMQGETAADRALAHAILAGTTRPDRLLDGLPHVLETSRSRTPNLYGLHAALYAPVIARLDPAADGATPFAVGALARALLASDRTDLAGAWLAALERRAAAGDRDAEDAMALLWPLFRVADGGGGTGAGAALPSDRVLLWRQALAARLGETPAARRELDRAHGWLLTVMEAAGVPVTAAHWQALTSRRVFMEAVAAPGTAGPDAVGAEAAARPGDESLAVLRQAAEDGRVGESVARALILLAADGPAASPARTVAATVAALRRVGLERDARRLALAALLADQP